MPVKLEPKIVSLDPNDDNIILGIPEDIDPSTLPSDEPVRKVKIIQKHVKKSRMLLNRLNRVSFWVNLKLSLLRPAKNCVQCLGSFLVFDFCCKFCGSIG